MIRNQPQIDVDERHVQACLWRRRKKEKIYIKVSLWVLIYQFSSELNYCTFLRSSLSRPKLGLFSNVHSTDSCRRYFITSNQHYDIIIQLAFRLFFCCCSTIWNYSSTQHTAHRMNVKWNQSRVGDVDQPTNDDSEFWSDLIFFSFLVLPSCDDFSYHRRKLFAHLIVHFSSKGGRASKSRDIFVLQNL